MCRKFCESIVPFWKIHDNKRCGRGYSGGHHMVTLHNYYWYVPAISLWQIVQAEIRDSAERAFLSCHHRGDGCRYESRAHCGAKDKTVWESSRYARCLQAAAGRFQQVLLHHDSLRGMQEEEKVSTRKVHLIRHVAPTFPELRDTLWWSRNTLSSFIVHQYETVHCPRPPRPVWWPRLAHVPQAQERNGGQRLEYRYDS